MIDLYTAPTPNGWKVSVMLEETGLPYEVHPVDLMKGQQKTPEFLALNPNGRIPVIVDREADLTIFESGAILIYLAEKTGKLLPAGGEARKTVLEWLMWQMGGVGPMFGQAHHFNFYAKEKIDYAMTRYSNEANRLYGVLERQLEGRDYVADDYSIADIAIFPWTRSYKRQNVVIEDYPNVVAWRKRMIERPAVAKGMQAGAEFNADLRELSSDEWKRLFGA